MNRRFQASSHPNLGYYSAVFVEKLFNMELILWRHAEAEDSFPDLARALTAKGHKQAKHIAAWLKPRLPEDIRILASPATRAQQTAAALGMDFITVDEIAPDADAYTLLEAAGWPHDHGSVLIVGHQPTLGGAVWWFTSRNGDPHDIYLRAALTPDLAQD